MFILKKIGKGRKKEKETTVHYGSLIKMLNTNSLKKSEEGSEAKAADRAAFHSDRFLALDHIRLALGDQMGRCGKLSADTGWRALRLDHCLGSVGFVFSRVSVTNTILEGNSIATNNIGEPVDEIERPRRFEARGRGGGIYKRLHLEFEKQVRSTEH